MDISTSWRARSGQMNGTLRVEQGYAKALTELMGPQIRFCRFHQIKRRFLPVGAYPDFSRKPVAKSRKQENSFLTSLRILGKRIERPIRSVARSVAAKFARNLPSAEVLPVLQNDDSCEVLLMTGENWSQYDFCVIAELRKSRGLKVAALCQDFIPVVCPQFFADGEFVSKFDAYANFLINNTDLIITISKSTMHDVLKYANDRGGLRGYIKIIHLGADLPVLENATQPSELSDAQAERFVLSVSTIQSRKNFDLLYHVWHRLAEQNTPNLPTLVIVGQPGFGSGDLLWQIENDPVTRGKIVVLHRASDDNLSWLYQNCLWTMYPSFYEGWGLPVSESLAFGKYCLASNTSSMPEAGAGLAGHIDPLDFASWRNAVVELNNSPEQLAHFEKTIREEYRPTTWASSAGILANELTRLSTKTPSTLNG